VASSRAIEAARAFVRIGGEDGPLRKTLSGVTGLLRGTAASVGRMTSQALAFTGGTLIAGGIAKATSAVLDFAATGAAIDDISERTGASAKAISGLSYAAEMTGANIADIEKGGRKLGEVLHDASTGSKVAAESLAAVGLSAKDLAGLSFEQQLMAVAEGLKGIDDDGKKAAIAMDLLGKSGANLVPLMNEGAEGIQDLMSEAESLGLTLSDDQADAAAALDDSWQQLKATFFGASKVLTTALAPVFTTVFSTLTSGIPLVVTIARAFGELLTSGAMRAWQALQELTTGFAPLLDYVKTFFGGIVDALQSGDTALAGRIFWLTLKQAWVVGIDALSSEWAIWKKGFLDTFSSALTASQKLWRGWQKSIASGIVEVMAYVDSSIDAEAVQETLNEDYERAIGQIDRDAEKEQATRDAAFDSSIGTVNQDLEQARAEWAAAVAQARTQAEKVANDPSASAIAENKFTDLIKEMKAGDIATRVESAVKQSGSSGDIRTVSGASQLTGLINRTGEMTRLQLVALQTIASNTQNIDQIGKFRTADI
jgi:hypothetical protein